MVINSFVMSSPFVYIYYSTFMLAWQEKTGTPRVCHLTRYFE